MTAKDLLKWKVEPLAGAFSSPLQPLLRQLQQQLESGQFPDALRSLHDSFVFLTMLYGGIAVGSLRSVTPLGPDLTLLMDEKPSSEIWARLLRQSWQDWTKHPHHPALDAIRSVFFLGSRLQSSRLGARRHSRWLGLDARTNSNGESFGGWTETIRKAKNINPEAAARQLVMKLPLLNIWLRASQDFLANWTLRLDPRQEPGQFRYLLNRDDCRFDTQPNLSLDQLLLNIQITPQGDFTVTGRVSEAPTVPVAPAAPVKSPEAAPVAPAAKGDVGLQWDPVTKSYRLVGGPPAKPIEKPAAPVPAAVPPPTPPAPATKPNVGVEWDAASNSYKMVAKTPAAEPVPLAPVTASPPDDIDAMLKAELQSLEDLLSDDPIADLNNAAVKPGKGFGEVGSMGLDFLMGDSAPLAAGAAAAKPKLGPPPLLDEQPSLDDLLASEAPPPSREPSLEELLGEEPVSAPATLMADEPPAEASLEELLGDDPATEDASLEELLGEDPPTQASLEELFGNEPVTEVSLEDLFGKELNSEASLEDLLGEEPTPEVAAPVVEAISDELIPEKPPVAPPRSFAVAPPVPDSITPSVPVAAPVPEALPSLDDLLAEESTAPAVPEAAPSLDDLLANEPPAPVAPPVAEAAPSLDDLLADEPPVPVAPLVPEAAPSLDDLLAEETPAPVAPPVPEAAPSLDDLLADEPPVPVAPPVPEAAPSLDDLLANEPPAPVAPPVPEAAPSLDDLLAEETPAPVAPPVPEAVPSLDDLLAEETPAPVAPPVPEAAPSLDDLLANEPPAPVAPPVPEAAPSLDDLLAEETPAPVAPPVAEAAPALDDRLADEPPAPVAPPVPEAAPSLDDLLADEPPAPVAPPVPEAAPSLADLLAEETPAPLAPPVPEAAPSLDDLLANEPPAPVAPPVAEAAPSLDDLLADEPTAPVAPPVAEAAPSLDDFLADEPLLPVAPPVSEVETSLDALLALDLPVPPGPESTPSLDDLLLFEPQTPPTPPTNVVPAFGESMESLSAATASAEPATVVPALTVDPHLDALHQDASPSLVPPLTEAGDAGFSLDDLFSEGPKETDQAIPVVPSLFDEPDPVAEAPSPPPVPVAPPAAEEEVSIESLLGLETPAPLPVPQALAAQEVPVPVPPPVPPPVPDFPSPPPAEDGADWMTSLESVTLSVAPPASLETVIPAVPPEPVAPPPPMVEAVVPIAPPEPVAPPPPVEAIIPVAPPEPVTPPPPVEAVIPVAPPEPVAPPSVVEAVIPVAPPEPVAPPVVEAVIPVAPPEPVTPPPPVEAVIPVAPPEPVAPPPVVEAIIPVAPPEPVAPPPPVEAVIPVAPPEPVAPPPPVEAVIPVAPPEPVAPPVVEAIIPVAPPEPVAPPPPVEAVIPVAPPEPVAPPPPVEAVIPFAPPEPVTPPPPVEAVIPVAPPEPVAPPPVVEAVIPVAPPEPVATPMVVEAVIPVAPPEPVAPPMVEAFIPVAAPERVSPPPVMEIVTTAAASVLIPHLPAEPSLTVIPVEEEIEEYDTYQFDPNSGPPTPPWKAWTSAERANLDEATQALQERMAHMDFSYLLENVRAFINKGRSGYLLLEGESGVGKSYLGTFLESTAPQVHPRGIRIAYLKTTRRPHGDYELLIETINDQIQASNAPRTHRLQPLDRLALQDLAVQYPSDKRAGRFAAFTTLLTVQNRGPILLYLDEIDRREIEYAELVSPSDFLPEQLPDNVYVVIPYRPDSPDKFLQKLKALNSTRLTLEPVAAEYRKQLDGDLSQLAVLQNQNAQRAAVMQANEFRLHYSRLAGQGVANQLAEPQTKWSELYATLLSNLRNQRPERFHALQHFLMTLCAAFEPISWDDIDQWGTSVDTLKELVDLLPATLLQQKLGMFLCVDIAHESLRDFLINQNKEAFSDVCRILTGWTVHTLQAAGELKLQSEQGREWARANFFRLYRWSLLSQDVTTLEWVVRNKDLQKKRIAISQALETSARTHQKLGLLDLWVECLRQLTEDHDRADLKDELAWALNSRGLTYLTLHRRQRALFDLDRSVALFDTLVNKERQTQFRNGLAAAYNRRSEIHFSLHEYDQALKDSTDSVQLFTDLVEDMGRDDLKPLLAYAHRNQSSVWAAKGNLNEANRSMESAISLFVKLSAGADESRYSKDQASCHLQLAEQRQKAGQHQESLQESGRAVAMLSQLSERDASLDVRTILERAHFARGTSYLATDQADKAQRDFTKSITLSTQLVDEGRLDHRDELAEAYSLRGKTQLQAKQPKEGLRDFSKAIELRQKLLGEGRSDQSLALAQEFIQRAEVYRVDKQEEACQGDLASALNMLFGLRAQGGEVTSLLLTVHRQKAALGLQLGRYGDVVEDADQALKLLKATLTGDPEQEAQLYSLRGESSRRLLHSEKARADFEAAVSIYTDLLKNKGGSTYLLGIAQAYGDLARVSLTTGHLDRAQDEVNRSVEALEVAAKDAQAGESRALLAQAYSTRAEVLERQGQHHTAKQELVKTLGIYSKLVEAEGQTHLIDEQALAYRRLGRTLLSLNEPNPARDALEQSTKRYKDLWSKDRKGPWLDELSRTQVVNSAASVVLKEYGAAEEEIQRSQEHFSGLLDQGKVEYFNDVFQTSMQRARNFIRVGMHAKANDELTRLLELLKRTAAQFDQVDFRESQARVLQSKAGVSSSLQSFEQAYNDFETAIQTLQPLVVEESQFHLGRDLADMYRQRAKMLLSAGHLQPGIADLSQAAQVLSILLSQGREELRMPLAQVAQERATAYLNQNELVAGVEDLNLGIELLMSLAGRSDDAELFAMLAQMLAQRGRCFQQAQQNDLASDDFEKAVQLYSRLVEQQGRGDLSAVLAECLLSHLSLSGQGVEDPQRLQALVKAVRLVTQQTKDGKPADESFVVDAVTAVRNSLSQRPEQASNELVDSVLKLCEAVLQVPRISFNWVSLTQLLSECYGMLEGIKGPKYVSFICLSCVSCGREVGSVGAASLPRLIYFLTLLGLTLGSERPGEQLGLVGNAFTNLLEQLARQRLDEAQALTLRQLVTTWQQLPAGYPAAANVSRGVLTNLLRAT